MPKKSGNQQGQKAKTAGGGGKGRNQGGSSAPKSFDVLRATPEGYELASAASKLTTTLSVYEPRPSLGAVVNAVSAFLHTNNGLHTADDSISLSPKVVADVKAYVLAKSAYEALRQRAAGSADGATVSFDFHSLTIEEVDSEDGDEVEEGD